MIGQVRFLRMYMVPWMDGPKRIDLPCRGHIEVSITVEHMKYLARCDVPKRALDTRHNQIDNVSGEIEPDAVKMARRNGPNGHTRGVSGDMRFQWP
uniref:Uncharacterized protein n=1 Tax=Anopheles dirus TaxID=7168 RepID=A0A182NWX5_9DIPT